MSRFLRTFWAVLAYIGCVVVANWLTANFGLVPVGFGLAATAGTYAAGATFVARDAVQDAAGRATVLAAIGVAAGFSSWLSTPKLAVASAAAFGIAELVDMAVYTPLRRRGYVRASVASNLAGALVDTVVFLGLAGFPITVAVVAGQLAGKAWLTVAAIGVVLAVRGVRRALLRDRFNRAGA